MDSILTSFPFLTLNKKLYAYTSGFLATTYILKGSSEHLVLRIVLRGRHLNVFRRQGLVTWKGETDFKQLNLSIPCSPLLQLVKAIKRIRRCSLEVFSWILGITLLSFLILNLFLLLTVHRSHFLHQTMKRCSNFIWEIKIQTVFDVYEFEKINFILYCNLLNVYSKHCIMFSLNSGNTNRMNPGRNFI